jgi:type VI protein secretion system component VasK
LKRPAENEAMNTNMHADEFLNVVDHAAGQDDRWLFLAAFCLLLALCAVVIYWLVRHLQAMIAEHKALQAEHSATLRAVLATQNETSLKLAVCIERNTAALEECSAELRRFRERAAH